MSYQVLARKWRPRNLQTLVGQEATVRILTNALQKKRLHHAYLFTGTRGVGKTTLGRILTKCFNCETGITPTPCNTCSICLAIDQGQFVDLYEVDAASRTKVEETRELLENIPYAPTQGRYKVYLIDEAHMLSQHSFNALLKTLEEPPEHVKFILATTEIKKLPITILSRCLQFHLKHITPEHITGHLQTICQAETIAYETGALEKLAHAANGSMRDALSLLDQAIAYSDTTLTADAMQTMLGNTTQDELYPLLAALASNDGVALFQQIASLAEKGVDFQQTLSELTTLLHQIAIMQIIPNTESPAVLCQLAQQLTPESIQLYYQIALLGKRDLEYAPSMREGFEMVMIRMLAFEVGDAEPSSRGSLPSSRGLSAGSTIIAAGDVGPADKPRDDGTTKLRDDSSTTKSHADQPIAWHELLPALSLTGMAYALAANCSFVAFENNKMTLALFANHAPMLNPKLQDRIQEALTQHFKRPIQLAITITTNEQPATPLKQAEQAKQKQIEGVKQSVLQNPRLKQLIDQYDATIEVSLLT